MEKSWENKPAAAARSDVINPIRVILERDFKIPENPPIPIVNLALGEPTKVNGFPLAREMKDAINEVNEAETFNGYTPSDGAPAAK